MRLSVKNGVAWLVLWCAAGSFAAVDVNRATVAELDGIKGVGPSLSRAILAERKTAPFSSWQDLINRVRGVKEATAIKLSNGGLTVQGQSFAGFHIGQPVANPQGEARDRAEAAEGAKVLQQVEQMLKNEPAGKR